MIIKTENMKNLQGKGVISLGSATPENTKMTYFIPDPRPRPPSDALGGSEIYRGLQNRNGCCSISAINKWKIKRGAPARNKESLDYKV